jgi:hypothetical protein
MPQLSLTSSSARHNYPYCYNLNHYHHHLHTVIITAIIICTSQSSPPSSSVHRNHHCHHFRLITVITYSTIIICTLQSSLKSSGANHNHHYSHCLHTTIITTVIICIPLSSLPRLWHFYFVSINRTNMWAFIRAFIIHIQASGNSMFIHWRYFMRHVAQLCCIQKSKFRSQLGNMPVGVSVVDDGGGAGVDNYCSA